MNHASLRRRLLAALLPLGLLAVPPVVSTLRSLSDVERAPRQDVAFDIDAAGTHAVADREWPIALDPGGEMGLSAGAAVCGDRAFLLDHKRKTIRRVSLSGGYEIDRIGGPPPGGPFAYLYAIGAACDAGKLFVSDYSGLVVLDLATGAVEARFPKPEAFSNSVGVLGVDAAAHRVFVPGLWARQPKNWLGDGLPRMFMEAWLGREVDLVTGETRRLVRPLERGCFTASPGCVTVSLDRATASREVAWIVAHKIGTRVGLYDASRRFVREIDVRSPLFQEDGRRVPRRARLVEEMRWHEHNSVIQAVWAFRDGVAVVHTIHRTKDWQLGGQVDFDVFVNVFGYDGRPLVSDVRLPDLPVARDAGNLYTMSYGAAGRRITGNRHLTIARFPIRSLVAGGHDGGQAPR